VYERLTVCTLVVEIGRHSGTRAAVRYIM